MATTQEVEAGIARITDRSGELVDGYCMELDKWVNEIVPPVLDNAEYAARCSALMISLNRQLSRCAASFGEVHGISDEDMLQMVFNQFVANYRRATGLLEGAGSPIQ